MMTTRPLFEVIVAADVAARRLVSVTTIRALTGLTEAVINDVALGILIDDALARCARSCRLARYRALPTTLAEEIVRASWTADYWNWWQREYYPAAPSTILLPWRAPITDLEITDGDTVLVEGTDFRLLGAGVIERVGAFWPTSGTIVVDYTAGFVPLSDDPSYQYDGEPLPADIVSLIADQVRMMQTRALIDLNLRSEDIPGVWSGTYNVAGGDAIDASGLINPLYDALSPYRAPASFA